MITHYVQVDHDNRTATFEDEGDGSITVCVSHACDEREWHAVTLSRDEAERVYELLKQVLGK